MTAENGDHARLDRYAIEELERIKNRINYLLQQMNEGRDIQAASIQSGVGE